MTDFPRAELFCGLLFLAGIGVLLRLKKRQHSSKMEFFAHQRPSKAFLAKSMQLQLDSEAEQAKSSCHFKQFQIGQRVRLHGMSRSALNDSEGVVVEPERGGRIAVKLTKASPDVLRQHSDGILVKWENVEWLTRRPIHEIIFHYSMYVDEESGKTLTLAESQAKFRYYLRAQEHGIIPSQVRMINADLRTNTDHMTRPDSLQFIQNRIGKLRNAYYSFTGHGPPVNMIDSECLSLYETFFEDMRQHSSIWNNFFENMKNTVWCERSVAMLNTYATVLRQRAETQRESKDERAFDTIFHCERVLNVGGKQLKRFKDSLANPRFLEVAHQNDATKFYLDQRCAQSLTYRYLLIKHNLLMQTGMSAFIFAMFPRSAVICLVCAGRGHRTNPSEVRFLCEQELDPLSGAIDCFGQSGNRLSVLMSILDLPSTRQSLSKTTNAKISAAYKAMSKNYCKTDGSETIIPNRMCGFCGHFQEEKDRMKRCGGCLTEFYCSPECQRSAWSDHQHICNPAP
jgi:hypothetical protein